MISESGVSGDVQDKDVQGDVVRPVSKDQHKALPPRRTVAASFKPLCLALDVGARSLGQPGVSGQVKRRQVGVNDRRAQVEKQSKEDEIMQEDDSSCQKRARGPTSALQVFLRNAGLGKGRWTFRTDGKDRSREEDSKYGWVDEGGRRELLKAQAVSTSRLHGGSGHAKDGKGMWE
ncbi:uncharacterized protein SPSK_09851 [Sporothrix schenckii 1099-18]|uniref:Uncharacterized protein n=1 Tax=Sporothrix schenckii 1099-18 TaxID=1397361 RepID=A0A0F2M8A8_SPOSC|nr:uncharacterized protein SPSK_09851 [Sporothrix schenckii 1099-18]KJR85928.1 hypothetical protein SPSK_09851 [Sporothrix schenckii 1099-18]